MVPTTADDGTRTLQLGGGVTITQKSANGDFLELLANNAVLFSSDRRRRYDGAVGRRLWPPFHRGLSGRRRADGFHPRLR